MCDYSLHAEASRLAREGERLVVHRFHSGSMGLASASELQTVEAAASCGERSKRSWWSSLWNWLGMDTPCAGVPAVCIPPGALLMVRDIPKGLRKELGVGEVEEVKFIQRDPAAAFTYHDGIRFTNSKEVLLQRLKEGQRIDVLSLGCEFMEEPERELELAGVL